VTLTFCAGLTPADWIAAGDLPWHQLVTFGPAGFDAYARLRLLPDPVRPGQSENDVEAEDWRSTQLPRLYEMLATHTTTPDDCYFCAWDGYCRAVPDADEAPYLPADTAARLDTPEDARPGLAPQHDRGSPSTAGAPKVVVPFRAYWLFRGPLAEVGTLGVAQGFPGPWLFDGPGPAFVWPADRAWCVAQDVDPHWAGIGGNPMMINQLVAAPTLDVVPADPAEAQPAYR
jgi:hypothetical protein